ncbi:hypothetical protein PMAYCL1PPCAC_23900 [Pristionchus mayeri]|uniref:RNA cytidine acetyltransferase n=1 Tax=Pristionchus mayeri TaxID=1317129 RepID=A0AAN5D0C2_9BILA|nr:hypothetical protein PMAYCL1PPCAC_23900 [Pristionchus mayeri]
MGRVKLDNRIRTLIERGVQCGHRSIFALVGDKARDQVVVLHHILSKATVSARPSVLWCYKKDLGFSSNRKKRMKDLKKKLDVGKINVREEDSFDVFISSTQIRYCYYSETQNILGNTYGMVILQDFEALTPNTLARTIETVEGGGLVVFLMRSINSLRQLYTMSMDVHNRYRTHAEQEIVPRFNERFILSLGDCKACAVLDEQLNVLPISSHMAKLEKEPIPSLDNESAKELSELKEAMKDTKPIGGLLNRCATLCQAKCLLRLLDCVTEKGMGARCSLSAGRGRGKSASLGLALAGAVAFGYTNIFVTSPSPENLKTLFEFVLKGFDSLDYVEHSDYELVRSTNPQLKNCLVRIIVNRQHRQIIQYIDPSDAVKLGQAELVVVDEAAAIPLPLVKQLISGPYLVFLASTINGYEGTGRSLSLKLLDSLRKQWSGEKGEGSKGGSLHEMVLEESIRYKSGDPVESWLNKLLCLDTTSALSKYRISGTPSPSDCELYYVNRDSLFSFHRASESFLQQILSIYVSAHYKNQPNDLQMLSDAPAHHLFVLMAPVNEEEESIPQVLVVMQVCLEGSLPYETVKNSLDSGKRAAGDLLPWTISNQFLDKHFCSLSGARIVRIAVHPDYQGMGYGGRAMELVEEYYQGNFPCLKEEEQKKITKSVKDIETLQLLEEQIAPRSNLPPLLERLNERRAENLDYLGVSFGLTPSLLKFWKKCSFVPVYLRQEASPLTGEHTLIALKNLSGEGMEWLSSFSAQFRTRFVNLLPSAFSHFPSTLALSILQLRNKEVEGWTKRKVFSREEIGVLLSDTDLGRLSSFTHNLVDHRLISDVVPTLARLFLNHNLSASFQLAPTQIAVLLAFGLQHKSMEAMCEELDGMAEAQVLALFKKTMRKMSVHLDEVCKDAVRERMEKEMTKRGKSNEGPHMKALAKSLAEDLEEAAREIEERQERDKRTMQQEIDSSLAQYAIKGDEDDWEEALKGGTIATKGVSVRNKRAIQDMPIPEKNTEKEAMRKKKKMKH